MVDALKSITWVSTSKQINKKKKKEAGEQEIVDTDQPNKGNCGP